MKDDYAPTSPKHLGLIVKYDEGIVKLLVLPRLALYLGFRDTAQHTWGGFAIEAPVEVRYTGFFLNPRVPFPRFLPRYDGVRA